MNRFIFGFTTIFLQCFFQLYAQGQDHTVTVHGTVSDKSDHVLPGITVRVEGTFLGSATGADGTFVIKQIPAGAYRLIASGIGYVPQVQEVKINPGQHLKLDFYLVEDTKQLNEVVVIGQSEENRLRESAKAITVVDTKVAKLQTADLGEVLAQISGVNVRRSGGLGSTSRFSLNGLTDDQIRFMMDGIPLDIMGYTSGIANVPVNLVDRVEIYKGVVPVDLGADALGGAVNLVTPKEFMNRGDFSYQIGSFGTHRLALSGERLLNTKGIFVRGSAFYDHARNNYEVDVEVPGEGGKLTQVTVPRFHDAYKAKGIRGTLGVRDQQWADEISLEVFATQGYKEIQNNNVMSIVYGKITSKVENYGALVRYRRTLWDKLDLNVIGGYSLNKVNFVDTSRYIYTWLGDVVKDANGKIKTRTPGELGQATDRLIWDKSSYGRAVLAYKLAPRHTLRLASAPTFVLRSGNERWDEESEIIDPLNEVSTIFTWVNGFEYSMLSADDKLENNLFVKSYIQNVRAEELTSTKGVTRNQDRNSQNLGFGNSLRYKVHPQWLLKASYEWATRLPRPEEIFGNGRLILPNLSLKPERSHNANLEINYSSRPSAQHDWKIMLNGFLRETDQLILLLGNNEVFSYQNVFNARSLGIEAAAAWESPNKRFSISGNVTMQEFRNQSSKGSFGPYEGDRIPNRPYFFVNNTLNYRIVGLFSQMDKMDVFLVNRYVHEFYRGWESVGLKQFKDVIPSQYIPNLGTTYELPFKLVRTSMTAEIQNLTDAKVYDFFGVQKPGRTLYFKITTQF